MENLNKDEKKTIDSLTDAERADLIQYRPTEEELRALVRTRVSETKKISEVMGRAAENAEGMLLSKVQPKVNNSGDFVNRCYLAEGVDLMFLVEGSSVKKMTYSNRLAKIYEIGDRVKLGSLMRGDLIFLNRDRHVGIHVGGGDFITYKEGRGLVLGNISDRPWSEYFESHVMRLAK